MLRPDSVRTSPTEAAREVKSLATGAGFDVAHIADANPLSAERERFLEWIEQGRQGEMSWITPERARRSSEPTSLLPDARSIVCVALAYWSGPRTTEAGRGKVARYAWGRDYHAVLGEKLERFADVLRTRFGGEYRWCVDTSPAMDKAFAARSGLGWYGKNTNILTGRFGSLVLLGEVLTTLHLESDPPTTANCGTCTLCLRACPTGALDHEYRIDSRRCISYLTIEHRGPIPVELRPLLGSWVFGCDICQDVCPPTVRPLLDSPASRQSWVRSTRQQIARMPEPSVNFGPPGPVHSPFAQKPMIQDVDLVWLLSLTHGEYLDAFRGTSIRRAKTWMLRRNAAVALGNVGELDAITPLARAAAGDEHPIVRGHAAWALGRIGSRWADPRCGRMLNDLLDRESDESVQSEIEWSLAMQANREVTSPASVRSAVAPD